MKKQLWTSKIPLAALCLGLAIFLAGCTATSTPPASTPVPDEGTKLPQPLPTSLRLESGYILSLTGGLSEAGRAQLEAGETGYFVLAYASTTSIPTEGVEIGNMIDRSVFFGIVQPSALETILEQASAGQLRYAGPLPPEAKLSTTLAEEIKSLAPDTRVDVEIFLITPLNDVQRLELNQWVIIESESREHIYFITGSVEVQYIPDLLSFPVIRLVDQVAVRRLPSGFPTPPP